jgi:hypothetical protein
MTTIEAQGSMFKIEEKLKTSQTFENACCLGREP